MTKTKIQINRNMQENLCMAYIKFFIARPTDKTFLIWAMENLSTGYYFNNVQEMEMLDMCRRLAGAFGTEIQYNDFKEVNLK